MSQGNNAASRLLAYIHRVESLDRQIAELQAEKKDEFSQAKSEGFSVRAIKQMVTERKYTPEERRSWAALLQAYRAALGMLDGTPLGDEARRQFFPTQPAPDTIKGDPNQQPLPEVPEAPKPPAVITAEDIEAARAEGADAARGGKLITDNPHPFDDQRRAAWDEGYCMHADDDDDGMGIPKAFRPKEKPKKDAATDGQPAANDAQRNDQEAA